MLVEPAGSQTMSDKLIIFDTTWRDGEILFYNNVVAENHYGFLLGGPNHDTHVNVDTRIRNNVLINNEAYGVRMWDQDNNFANTTIDTNLYQGNGWGSSLPGPGA